MAKTIIIWVVMLILLCVCVSAECKYWEDLTDYDIVTIYLAYIGWGEDKRGLIKASKVNSIVWNLDNLNNDCGDGTFTKADKLAGDFQFNCWSWGNGYYDFRNITCPSYFNGINNPSFETDGCWIHDNNGFTMYKGEYSTAWASAGSRSYHLYLEPNYGISYAINIVSQEVDLKDVESMEFDANCINLQGFKLVLIVGNSPGEGGIYFQEDNPVSGKKKTQLSIPDGHYYVSIGLMHVAGDNVGYQRDLFVDNIKVNYIGVSEPVCSSDSDCGTDSWLGNEYCNGDNVWDTYRTWICNNPGTSSASCTHVNNNQLKESCADTCESGTCVGIECSSDSDCGTNSWLGSAYCNGNNVWQTYRTYTCNNPGTSSASCTYDDDEQLKESCADTCESGVCVDDNPSEPNPEDCIKICTNGRCFYYCK